jgi:hypothetical protein
LVLLGDFMHFADQTIRFGIILREFAVFLLLPILVGGVARSCFAQDGDKEAPAEETAPKSKYLQDAPDKALQKSWNQIRPILQEGKFSSPAAKTLFDNYFENYEFKAWTLDDNLPKLVAMRNQLKNNFRQAKSGQVYDRLNELTVDVLGKKLKNNKYSPTFLVNAMLAIGDLNKTQGGPGVPLEPLPAALTVLLENLKDERQLDAVKVAALAGIRHQIAYGVKDPAITAALVKLASSKEKSDGKVWMKKQSVELLGMLQSPGPNNQVADLLFSILDDKKAAIDMRCAAAESLGKINLSNSNIDASKTIVDLKQLMVEGCEAELKAAEKESVGVSRRMMKTYYDAVTLAIGDSTKGLISIINAQNPPNAKQQLTDLQGTLKELFTTLDIGESSDDDLKEAVETAKKKLKK